MRRTKNALGSTLAVSLALLASASAAIASDASGPRPNAGERALPQGGEPVDLDPMALSADVDNPYFPLLPGARWHYRELDDEGNLVEVVVTVSTETKAIANGVTARVVRDTVTADGELVEDTLDWYAQDAEGNVWYLGEETAEFEDGALTSNAGSFEAGVDGALPGIIMPAHPTDGMRYRQEYYAGEAEDNGEIVSTEERASVPYGHFDDVILTKDTITIQPDVLEYKLYARDIGLVMALGISGGGGREELVAFERVAGRTARLAGAVPLGEPYP